MIFGNISITFSILFFVFFIVLYFFIFYAFFKIFIKKNKKTAYDKIYKNFGNSFFYIIIILFYIIFIIIGHIFLYLIGTGIYKENLEETKNKNIFFVLDSSFSMYAQDMPKGESRFNEAKKLIFEIIQKNENHKFALFIFSGKSYEYIPLSGDKNNILLLLDNLKIEDLHKNNLWTSGSSLGNSILHTVGDIKDFGRKNSKIIIIADGGVTDGISLKKAKDYAQNFASIFYISIGSTSSSQVYIPTAYSGISQINQINPRDDSPKKIFGENFFVFFDKEDKKKILDFFYEQSFIKKYGFFHKNIIFFIILIFTFFVFLFSLSNIYIGQYRNIFIFFSLIFLILNFLQIFFLFDNSEKEYKKIILKNKQDIINLEKEIFKYHKNTTNFSIYYEYLGKENIFLPADIEKQKILKKIYHISSLLSDGKNTENIFLDNEKTKNQKYFFYILILIYFINFFIFIKRY